jgi:protein gp37
MRDWLRDRAVVRNVWLGVSVEDQKNANERLPYLMQTPAAARWVSCEPLLGPMDLAPWLGNSVGYDARALRAGIDAYTVRPGLRWVVAGPETGRSARWCAADWWQCLQLQCIVAEVPFFLKRFADGSRVDAHGARPDLQKWPEDEEKAGAE